MAELNRNRVKRHGLKGSVTKLLAKVEDVLSAELETVNLDSTPESQRLLAATTATQLTAKKSQIEKLDNAIVAAIEEETELEAEVCDADTYQTTLEERIVFLEEFVKRASQPTTPDKSRESIALISATPDIPTTVPEVVKKPIHSADAVSTTHETVHTESTYQSYSRLPKLALPTFNGNPLQWQTFWDSFSAAIDCNPHLSNVQKLNYLRTQVQGDAAHIIDGFQLIDINYAHSVELLITVDS